MKRKKKIKKKREQEREGCNYRKEHVFVSEGLVLCCHMVLYSTRSKGSGVKIQRGGCSLETNKL